MNLSWITSEVGEWGRAGGEEGRKLKDSSNDEPTPGENDLLVFGDKVVAKIWYQAATWLIRNVCMALEAGTLSASAWLADW